MAGKDTSYKKRKALFEDKAPELLLHLKLSAKFWASLVTYDVIQKHHANDIQVAFNYSLSFFEVRIFGIEGFGTYFILIYVPIG